MSQEAGEVVRRRRSRSRSRPPDAAAAAAEAPPVKPKRRWRRVAAVSEYVSSSSASTRASRRASDPNGTDEPGATSDAGGWTDGGGDRRPPSPERSETSEEDNSAAPTGDCDGEEHNGRRVISTEVPINIDQLFTMLFTNSEFFQNFYRKLKYYDVSTTEWEDNGTGCKTRTNRFLVDAMGKTTTSTVTEDQTMLPISQPGKLYVINAEVKNSGVPMADLFYTTKHYCIHRLSSKRTKLEAWCQTKFRKSTLFRGFIEKTANEGMEEHHNTLEQMLGEWVRSPDRGRVPDGGQQPQTDTTAAATAAAGPTAQPAAGAAAGPYPGAGRGLLLLTLTLTLVLLALNAVLYTRLSHLGRQTELLVHSGLLQAGVRPDPDLLERLTSVQLQREQQREQMARWQQTVRSAAQLVKQSESALSELQGFLEDVPEPAGSGVPPASLAAAAAAAAAAATAGDTARGLRTEPGPASTTVAQ